MNVIVKLNLKGLGRRRWDGVLALSLHDYTHTLSLSGVRVTVTLYCRACAPVDSILFSSLIVKLSGASSRISGVRGQLASAVSRLARDMYFTRLY